MYLRLVCFSQGKIYMYGGKIDSTGNVSSQLWVFHIQNQTWVLLSPRANEQYAVVGHSAHIIPPSVKEGASPVMLVLFGHCPLYGYISQVQEYNIGTFYFLRVVESCQKSFGLQIQILCLLADNQASLRGLIGF